MERSRNCGSFLLQVLECIGLYVRAWNWLRSVHAEAKRIFPEPIGFVFAQ
jgi:hypothetical protein